MSRRKLSTTAPIEPDELDTPSRPSLLDQTAFYFAKDDGAQVKRLREGVIALIMSSIIDDGISLELASIVALDCGIRGLIIRSDDTEVRQLLTAWSKMLQGRSNDVRIAMESRTRFDKKLAEYCVTPKRKLLKIQAAVKGAATASASPMGS
jgi:hypothetical protein